MKLPRRQPNAGRTAAATFVVLILVIPIALMVSVQPRTLAVTLSAIGAACLLGSLCASPRIRGGARSAGKGLITAAAILAIIHFSGLLEPFYRREGWLLLDLESEVVPLHVSPGDTLTYTLSTTNTGIRPARGRRFLVDDVPYTGVLMHGLLPALDGARFPISGPPTTSISSEAEPQGLRESVCAVVYANPGLPEPNPAYWDWSATYTPGWKIVAAITSDGCTNCDLGVGETLTLQYRVTVPPDHPSGEVHHVRGSLSYRDPQWGTYYIHDLRFPFEEIITVDSAPG